MGAVIGSFTVELPRSFLIHQQIKSDDTYILGLEASGGYVNVMARRSSEAFSPEEHFFNDVEVLRAPSVERVGAFQWWLSDTKRVAPMGLANEISYSTNFFTEVAGWQIFGNSRHEDRLKAQENAHAVLSVLAQKDLRSLTGPEYAGKKYYLGWGAAGVGDPTMMQNEVKYDVLHTHNIFTSSLGGDYIGTKLVGPSTATAFAIRNAWKAIGKEMKPEDMYVQYSSGHGSHTGLGVGVSYAEIRDTVLGYPAQELVVFIMACYSGSLVQAFDAKKTVWGDWKSKGRTLFVFASSGAQETSSTGPGTDPDEENGPNGSAGSAFGFSLWKALIGYADGYIDGVKDGYLSLAEIEKFTKAKSLSVGDHNPVATGVYNSALIMNKVPPKSFRDQYDRIMSDAELSDAIQRLDAEMRIQ